MASERAYLFLSAGGGPFVRREPVVTSACRGPGLGGRAHSSVVSMPRGSVVPHSVPLFISLSMLSSVACAMADSGRRIGGRSVDWALYVFLIAVRR